MTASARWARSSLADRLSTPAALQLSCRIGSGLDKSEHTVIAPQADSAKARRVLPLAPRRAPPPRQLWPSRSSVIQPEPASSPGGCQKGRRLIALVVSWLARYASIVKTASAPGKPATCTRRLLRCGQAAGPVFVAAFLAEGAVRDGYLPPRHPVSSLALGWRGWIQAANFVVTGTLFLAGAAGPSRAGYPAISSRAARALIGAAGAGLIGSAVFPTDPANGYPPGSPDALPGPSRTGAAHNLAAIPSSSACTPPRSTAAGGPGGPASAGSRSTAPAPPSPC
jgi:hypothetical protein